MRKTACKYQYFLVFSIINILSLTSPVIVNYSASEIESQVTEDEFFDLDLSRIKQLWNYLNEEIEQTEFIKSLQELEKDKIRGIQEDDQFQEIKKLIEKQFK